MGNVKTSNRDGRILFHVGKELPEEGSDFLLVPGRQSAQGRGIYTETSPNLSYAGGEHYRKEVDTIPIFLLPAQGRWARAKMKKKGGKIIYHSAGGILHMKNLRFVDSELEGKKVRYYFTDEIERIQEPKDEERLYSPTYELRANRMSQEQVLDELRKKSAKVTKMDKKLIQEKLRESIERGLIPESVLQKLERLSEHDEEIKNEYSIPKERRRTA